MLYYSGSVPKRYSITNNAQKATDINYSNHRHDTWSAIRLELILEPYVSATQLGISLRKI
jgi:hypothetical protein